MLKRNRLAKAIVEGLVGRRSTKATYAERLGMPSRAERDKRDEDIARRAAKILKRRGPMTERDLLRTLRDVTLVNLRSTVRSSSGRRRRLDIDRHGMYRIL